MKFSIQREDILKPLQTIIGVVERRQTLPVLSNILMVVNDDGLSMTTTDLEVEMVAKTTLENSESGEKKCSITSQQTIKSYCCSKTAFSL